MFERFLCALFAACDLFTKHFNAVFIPPFYDRFYYLIPQYLRRLVKMLTVYKMLSDSRYVATHV